MAEDDSLQWVMTLKPYTLNSGAEHFYASMAITTLEKHQRGDAPAQTRSSPHGLILERLREAYDYVDNGTDRQRFDAAAKEMKAALDKNPVPFSAEEIQAVQQIEALLVPHMPDAHAVAIEVITALHWESPFVMNGSDFFPLSPEDCESYTEVLPPAQVVHQQPFPEFPFLGFTQLWGGEVLSVAVGREPAKGLLRVVTLDEHRHPYDDSDIYSFWHYSVLHVPGRFFRFSSKEEASNI